MLANPQRKPDAFVFAGGFRVLQRSPAYLTELLRRRIRVLVVTPEDSRERAEKALGDSDSPISQITDIAYVDGALDRESSFNPGVFAALERWREDYRVVGVYAMEETLVEPAVLVSDMLGLPSPGLRAGRVCRSKYLQRAFLNGFGPESLTVPPGRRRAVDTTALKYPAVLKPATRHASSGVVVCEAPEELAGLLPEYPGHETLLIEQKVTGQEYSVESLIQNSETIFASFSRKETTEPKTRSFVELSHSVPGEDTRYGDRSVGEILLEANQRVLDILGFENGVTHSEWRVTATGELFLMEIASRTPGDGLTLLYEQACGTPLETQIVRIALGEAASYPAPRRRARQVYLEHRPGILRDVRLDWPGTEVTWVGEADLWPTLTPGSVGDPPALRALIVLKARGERLETLRSSDDRTVSFLIDADTTAELDALEARVRLATTIEVD
ncbi:ATP-grasp domain-containing protein [Lipingzhangella sp. LS1_29]|uniref:ATP-grasp domain-containing protein n=1 Tax=Lipingzhangella rawalii TaxID=2055835 RepID=A0ABU2H889_9ACTN|nr:ATP-grasp domain-containing protein [Lipingzhangella rawalii]MDS1271514.1 ATP-grasp domain-containing protein [Lipingzhangella rawalii]